MPHSDSVPGALCAPQHARRNYRNYFSMVSLWYKGPPYLAAISIFCNKVHRLSNVAEFFVASLCRTRVTPPFTSPSLSKFFQFTARPHKISVQALSSQSIVSSSRTVRACAPWEGRWIGQWRTTSDLLCHNHKSQKRTYPKAVVSKLRQARNQGGGHLPKISKHCIAILTSAETFKEQRWNFIFQSFLRSLLGVFLCLTGKLSPYKIYLETGYLIENFVNDWYLTTNMLEVSKLGREFKMFIFLRHFLSICSCTILS